MNACLQNAYTKVGNQLVSVETLVDLHAKQCRQRLEARKKKKRRAYSGY